MRSAFAALLITLVGFAGGASAQSLAGQYRVQGTNPDGSSYGGTATITVTSDTTCRIEWQTGSTSAGICMRNGNAVAAAYKLGSAIGLVIYQLQPNGALQGLWTVADQSGAGTETLVPVR
jgi:hypothetical protein